jgi:hypothetical protein
MVQQFIPILVQIELALALKQLLDLYCQTTVIQMRLLRKSSHPLHFLSTLAVHG